MATVILKWNPNFSSYNMLHYLSDLARCNRDDSDSDFDWSVWDYEKIHTGDRFYWVKLGYGQVGIVGAGEITSEPFEAEDWSGKGRRTFYVEFMPDLLINPDALPILTAAELSSRIPDFEWTRGHSGLVLSDAQAEELEKLWHSFVEEHKEEFEKKAPRDHRYINDYIYWKK